MINYRFDEPRRDFGIDCIAVTAQSSHAGGSPMSQRECAGFNWPPFSIPASEPVSILPEAVSRCGPVIAAAMLKSCGAPFRAISDIAPASVRMFFSASDAREVGQPVRFACRGNWSSRWVPSDRGLMSAPESFQSRVVGVVQPHSATVARLLSLFPAAEFPFCAGVPAIGVGQPASAAVAGSIIDPEPERFTTAKSGPACFAIDVGHPERAVSDVRRAEARSRKRDTPEGVTQRFHVSLYKVEPRIDVATCNLLAKDVDRASLGHEPVRGGPKVPLVSKPSSFACRAERLAWAGHGPNGAAVGPTGATQGVGPDPDAGEEVALSKSSKFIWTNIADVPFVNDTGRNVASGNEFAQPRRSKRIDFVVVSPAIRRAVHPRHPAPGLGGVGGRHADTGAAGSGIQ